MLRITALADFIAFISLKHVSAIAAISILFAAVMAATGHGQNRPLMTVVGVCANACMAGVLLLVLSFFVFAFTNSAFVPRYGASDLFLSILLVQFGFCLCGLAHRSLREPGFFDPLFVAMAAVLSLVMSGLLAVLLPLMHRLHMSLFPT